VSLWTLEYLPVILMADILTISALHNIAARKRIMSPFTLTGIAKLVNFTMSITKGAIIPRSIEIFTWSYRPNDNISTVNYYAFGTSSTPLRHLVQRHSIRKRFPCSSPYKPLRHTTFNLHHHQSTLLMSSSAHYSAAPPQPSSRTVYEGFAADNKTVTTPRGGPSHKTTCLIHTR